MYEQAVIDALEFALNRETLADEIRVDALDRLGDVLYSSEGAIEYKISGYVDENAKPGLNLSIQGILQLRCLRCLNGFGYPLHLDSRIGLVRSEAELPDLDDEPSSVENIIALPKMKVAELVEDEIILNLPSSPRHPAGECALDASRLGAEADEARASPFAVLKERYPKQ